MGENNIGAPKMQHNFVSNQCFRLLDFSLLLLVKISLLILICILFWFQSFASYLIALSIIIALFACFPLIGESDKFFFTTKVKQIS